MQMICQNILSQCSMTASTRPISVQSCAVSVRVKPVGWHGLHESALNRKVSLGQPVPSCYSFVFRHPARGQYVTIINEGCWSYHGSAGTVFLLPFPHSRPVAIAELKHEQHRECDRDIVDNHKQQNSVTT